MRWALAAVLLTTGCHALFSLDEVELPLADAAPPQGDRDGDLLVGSNDNCPVVSNPDQGDADTDGIGDACDPNRDDPDMILLQEFFDGDAAGWSTAPDVWNRQPGAWTSPPASANNGALIYNTALAAYRPSLQIGFTLDAFDAGNETKELVAHLDESTSEGDCSFRYDPDVGQEMSLLVLHHSGGNNEAEHITPAFAPGTSYLLTYRRWTMRSCTVMNQTAIFDDDVVETFSANIAIFLDRMQVTIHHVTVYTRVP